MSQSTTVSGIIYGLHNGDGEIRYIGYTTRTAETRLREHVYASGVKQDRHVYKWMRKHGPENIQIIVLERHDNVELEFIYEREMMHISERTGLTNTTVGGEGIQFTDEIRAKISAALKGRAKSAEHLANSSAARLGKPSKKASLEVPQETREKIRATLKGRPLAEETKVKMSLSRKGKPHNPEHAAKLAHSRWCITGGKPRPDCSYC